MVVGQLTIAQRDDDQAVRRADAPQDEAEQVDGALVGPVQVVDDQHRRLRGEAGEHRPEDLVGLLGGLQRGARPRVEEVGHVVQRPQRTGRGQRVARTPQQGAAFHRVGERADQRGLAGSRVALDDDHAAATEARLRPAVVERGQLLGAFEQRHAADGSDDPAALGSGAPPHLRSDAAPIRLGTPSRCLTRASGAPWLRQRCTVRRSNCKEQPSHDPLHHRAQHPRRQRSHPAAAGRHRGDVQPGRRHPRRAVPLGAELRRRRQGVLRPRGRRRGGDPRARSSRWLPRRPRGRRGQRVRPADRSTRRQLMPSPRRGTSPPRTSPASATVTGMPRHLDDPGATASGPPPGTSLPTSQSGEHAMPRFVDVGGAPPRRRRVRNLLEQETVLMTVFAQDPSVADLHGPVLVQIPVPADRLQPGPRSHRFHVVDIAAGTNEAFRPAQLHDDGDAWSYTDRYAATTEADRLALIGDRNFRAQNVFAVAAHTLALFESHLGRPIPWNRRAPQLFLVPQARIEANAWYSREHNAVLFGWLPAIGDEPPVFTALSYDIVAHEVTHAILDGLRPRYTAPGPPDQLAFHEALADLVALFSVFGLPGVAQDLLDPRGTGRYRFPRHAAGLSEREVIEARADHLKRSPLAGLAEQLGRREAQPSAPGAPPPALRRSVDLPATAAWKRDPTYAEPHRRAEVLVAAFMQTFVTIWAERLQPLAIRSGGMDVTRLAPEDDHGYRTALERSFAEFGIVAPVHDRIVDTDGTAAPKEPSTATDAALRYEHLNFGALRTSPEEVVQFIWNNDAALRLDVRLLTNVERVLASTRVGPDGLILNEVIADYTQVVRTTAGRLPPGVR